MSETTCRGCEFWGNCAGGLSAFMGWGGWGSEAYNGDEARPDCHSWQSQKEREHPDRIPTRQEGEHEQHEPQGVRRFRRQEGEHEH